MKGTPLQWAMVLAPAAAFGTAFLWTATAASHNPVAPSAYIEQLETNIGHHEGFRRNHAKGISVSGYFEGAGNLSELSSSEFFDRQRSKVVGRFSIPGPPSAPDNQADVRALGLMLISNSGEEWRMAVNSTPVFVVSTPEAVMELFKAQSPSAPKDAVATFMQSNPETKTFRDFMGSNPPSASFASAPYHSINSFYFISDSGNRHPVRWKFEPRTSNEGLSAPTEPNGLMSEMLSRVNAGNAAVWDMYVYVADKDDNYLNATVNWQEDKTPIHAGVLVLNQAENQMGANCYNVNFDPSILPEGVEVSEDPLIAARSAVYSRSFDGRMIEQAKGRMEKQS